MNDKRIAATVTTFLIASSSAFAAGFSDLGRDELLPIHVVAMSAAAAGMLLGGLIARYLKKRTTKWLKIHKSFQWTSATLAVIGIATGIIMVENTTGIHLRIAHTVVALCAVILLAATIPVAYFFLKGKKFKKELRVAHRWLGRIAITSFLATIVLGMSAAGLF